MTKAQFILLRLARSLEAKLGRVPVHVVSVDLVEHARRELGEQGIRWDTAIEDIRASLPAEAMDATPNNHGIGRE